MNVFRSGREPGRRVLKLPRLVGRRQAAAAVTRPGAGADRFGMAAKTDVEEGLTELWNKSGGGPF